MTLESDELKLKAADAVIREGLSVRDAERLARSLSKEPVKGKRKKKRDPYYDEVELSLSEVLKRKVRVTKSSKNGRLEIEFFDDDDLKKLLKIFDDEY